MKKKLLSLLPYAAVVLAAFYLLPWLIQDTGSAMFVLLCIVPLVLFADSFTCGMRQGFQWVLPVFAALAFLPSLFLFYNSSAWPYSVAYGVVSLAGLGIGCIFHKRPSKNNEK